MNKLEAAYSEYLAGRRDVVWFDYEPVKLKLADRTYYTPDFLLMTDAGLLVAVEIKGTFQESDARVKIKVAAKQYGHLFQFAVVVAKATKTRGLEVLSVESFREDDAFDPAAGAARKRDASDREG